MKESLKDRKRRLGYVGFARETLSEEQYKRLIRSHKLLTVVTVISGSIGMIVPVVVIILYDTFYSSMIGLLIGGLLFMAVSNIGWRLPISREFTEYEKWWRDDNSTIEELEEIFK